MSFLPARYQKVIKDTGYYLLASVLPMILLIVINPLLAKNLEPEDYAIIGYISSFSIIVTSLVSFFIMRYYFVQYFKIDAIELDKIKITIVQSLLLFSLFMSIVIIGCIAIYHNVFNSESTLPIFPYLFLSVGTIWLGGIYTFQLSEYRLERKSANYFLLSLFNGIVKILCLLFFVVLLGKGALGYELAACFSVFVFFLMSFYRYRKYIFRKINKELFISILKFCWPLALAGSLEFFINGYSRVLLERLGDNQEYGYYIVGNQFATYISIFTMALFTAFNPDIYENASKKNMTKLYKIALILVSIEILTVLMFIVLAPFVIDILTAGKYIHSVQYARIISLSQIFLILFYFVNDLTIALGYSKVILYTKIIASVISLFLIAYIIRNWSFYGAAYGQTVIYGLFVIINISILIINKNINRKEGKEIWNN